MKKHICIGLLAHVDAGKTTLAEGILYTCGAVRNLGRVDHRDAALDNFELERARGITIFSKQAQVEWEGLEISLLDTPGHVDFSAEMERTLQVLDYAVLVIGGAQGVQGHVQTLWRLLKRYRVPVFIFVNKMDLEGADKKKILQELQQRLDENCVDFSEEGVDFSAEEAVKEQKVRNEALSLCCESLLEEYLETGALREESIAQVIAHRQAFPCYFGSALKLAGVDTLLAGIRKYALLPEYGQEFGARVFKISRDNAGNRLTHLKVTGGVLRVKMPVEMGSGFLDGKPKSPSGFRQKADQIRLYTGGQYKTVDAMEAGGICAVTGFTETFAGQGLGSEGECILPVLEPVLTYRVFLPKDCDAVKALLLFRQLEEEDPQLRIIWKEAVSEIHIQVMGEVQIEILQSIIKERFALDVEFGAGSIVYKETIAAPVVGIGHFEPLRHYAEVHLLLEPGEPGSGLQFGTACSEDVLDKNWQRLVLTHLEEKVHVGVLTGSEITDMRITLLTGRAHLKHTEGGDFRQATYRALRQGLKKSKSILLEPYFAFRLEVPTEAIGRAMSDIQRMNGVFDAPLTEGEVTLLTGKAPVAAMQDYQKEVRAYTRGNGRLSLTVQGYEPCHNAEEVVEAIQYDSESDLDNPTGSVFCAHGAGFVVGWEEVDEYAHIENKWDGSEWEKDGAARVLGIRDAHTGNADSRDGLILGAASGYRNPKTRKGKERGVISQEEIEEIFRQTYGKKNEDSNRYRRYHRPGRNGMSDGMDRSIGSGKSADKAMQTDKTVQTDKHTQTDKRTRKDKYLLVDGYNIIFAWEDLRELAAVNIDGARDKLMDILSNYQGMTGGILILVFDAYKVKGNPGAVQKYHNIYVVYTKEAETADQYIEKTVHEIGRKHDVTVATSDGLEQMIIWGDGANRMSAGGLREAIDRAGRELAENYLTPDTKSLGSEIRIGDYARKLPNETN